MSAFLDAVERRTHAAIEEATALFCLEHVEELSEGRPRMSVRQLLAILREEAEAATAKKVAAAEEAERLRR
jgi:hypothetical protein